MAKMVWVENLDVDGDIDAGREIEFLEFVDGLGRGLQDVDEPLVRAGFELLHGLLVDVRGAVDRKLHDVGGQRDGPETRAPERLAVSTISTADWSMTR